MLRQANSKFGSLDLANKGVESCFRSLPCVRVFMHKREATSYTYKLSSHDRQHMPPCAMRLQRALLSPVRSPIACSRLHYLMLMGPQAAVEHQGAIGYIHKL